MINLEDRIMGIFSKFLDKHKNQGIKQAKGVALAVTLGAISMQGIPQAQAETSINSTSTYSQQINDYERNYQQAKNQTINSEWYKRNVLPNLPPLFLPQNSNDYNLGLAFYYLNVKMEWNEQELENFLRGGKVDGIQLRFSPEEYNKIRTTGGFVRSSSGSPSVNTPEYAILNGILAKMKRDNGIILEKVGPNYISDLKDGLNRLFNEEYGPAESDLISSAIKNAYYPNEGYFIERKVQEYLKGDFEEKQAVIGELNSIASKMKFSQKEYEQNDPTKESNRLIAMQTAAWGLTNTYDEEENKRFGDLQYEFENLLAGKSFKIRPKKKDNKFYVKSKGEVRY